jgi:hypothetical protein
MHRRHQHENRNRNSGNVDRFRHEALPGAAWLTTDACIGRDRAAERFIRGRGAIRRAHCAYEIKAALSAACRCRIALAVHAGATVEPARVPRQEMREFRGKKWSALNVCADKF